MLADDLTGFGGLAEALLTDVAQEYRGRPVVLFSLRPALPGAEPRMGTALARCLWGAVWGGKKAGGAALRMVRGTCRAACRAAAGIAV